MLTDISQDVLARAMDAFALRGRAIANNIANVETPGYQRQDVAFEAALRSALDSGTDPGLEAAEPVTFTDSSQPARENGNNVDADSEMGRLAENTLRYQAVVTSYNSLEAILRSAIYEGKR